MGMSLSATYFQFAGKPSHNSGHLSCGAASFTGGSQIIARTAEQLQWFLIKIDGNEVVLSLSSSCLIDPSY